MLAVASSASAVDRQIGLVERFPLSGAPTFTHEVISPIDVVSEGHVSSVKNGVKFDVYFDQGIKKSAAIYAINTGRKQLALTPQHHKAILEDLIHRKFTVIVADFKDKKIGRAHV